MAYREDWLPGKRAEVLAMAGNWITQLSLHQAAWGVSPADLTDLTALKTAAQTALNAARGTARAIGKPGGGTHGSQRRNRFPIPSHNSS